MQHEPRRLLSNFQIAGNLITGDAILAVHYQPDRHEPLVEGNGRLLEDGSSLHRKLFAASTAFPDAPSPEEANILTLAVGANDALHPSQRGHKLNAYINIGEVPDDFNEAIRNVL